MKKYIEIGIGNRWFVRTEIEQGDGTETEQKGMALPIQVKSAYLRLWVWKTVFILDARRGFQITRKDRRKFKFVIGISGV